MDSSVGALVDKDRCFWFDRDNQQIGNDVGSTQLTPKAFAVLDYLYAKAPTLVAKNELLDAIWPNVCVIDAVLKTVVREVRKALGDDPRSPRFIQTVHARGYRFIGKELLIAKPSRSNLISMPVVDAPAAEEKLVVYGREREFKLLDDCWRNTVRGCRREVKICGVPGIGKSALVAAWLRDLTQRRTDVLVIESAASGTALDANYLTILDTLTQLCKSPCGELAIDALKHHAPIWMTRVPWLCSRFDLTPSTNSLEDSGHEQLYLQFAEFIEALSARRPLVWWLDDRHRCDTASHELLAYVATRTHAAKLMMISTYCSWQGVVEGAVGASTSRCQFDLCRLPEATTREFLDSQLKDTAMPSIAVAEIAQRSGGHPLYLEGAVRELKAGGDGEAQNSIFQSDANYRNAVNPTAYVPAMVCSRLDLEAAALSARQRHILQVASVVVVSAFSAAAIAAVLGDDVIQIEAECDELARSGQWIKGMGSRQWPDGTLAQLFAYQSSVYRDYWYQSLPAARRREFHHRHAKRLEVAYAKKLELIVKNLAYHFDRGGDPQRSAHYVIDCNIPTLTGKSAAQALTPLHHPDITAHG